jgi:hypothetical protein
MPESLKAASLRPGAQSESRSTVNRDELSPIALFGDGILVGGHHTRRFHIGKRPPSRGVHHRKAHQSDVWRGRAYLPKHELQSGSVEKLVVAVQKDYIIAACRRFSSSPGRVRSDIILPKIAYASIVESRYRRLCIVGGAVVDDNPIEVVESLIRKAPPSPRK